LHREDIEAFCTWLSEKEGRTYGLPTEEQWEWACRAGGMGRWFWGDEEDQAKQFGWFEDPATSARQMPVGLKSPNAFGLYDTAGNVAEIALDSSGSFILRGGHAGYGPIQTRSAAREIEDHTDPTYRNGFRIALFE
jgi:formylglycine-generating enzyme required for sulfatase activity